jgi:ADP-ribosylglycohydrolase
MQRAHVPPLCRRSRARDGADKMLGAIAGDVIGSVHEFAATKSMDFELFAPGCKFTDDTVLAVAVADCLLNGCEYIDTFHQYFRAYPRAGYGLRFLEWASAEQRDPYNSWGNGSAMRVPAVGHAFTSMTDVLAHAAASAEVTHNHPEGVKGAQATAAAIYMARNGDRKPRIKEWLEQRFGYDLGQRISDIRPTYSFDESCQRTVPPAIIAFLESTDYEEAVRTAISLGGDADTLACITGAIAEAHYGGLPSHIEKRTLAALDDRLRSTVLAFRSRYGSRRIEPISFQS